jgi:hypothetical protein
MEPREPFDPTFFKRLPHQSVIFNYLPHVLSLEGDGLQLNDVVDVFNTK